MHPCFINRIHLMKADFPQRKKQTKEVRQRNEALAERYNQDGLFPKVVLFADGPESSTALPYHHWNVDVFIEHIKDEIKAHTHRIYEHQEILMGTAFSLAIVDTIGSNRSQELLDNSVRKIRTLEHLISEWIDTTEVSRLNALAGKDTLQVDPELYQLIERSKMLSGITQGAFDITFGTLSPLWDFNGKEAVIPANDKIAKALQKTGHEHIHLLENRQVYLENEGMKIGFGGMGKGYSADRVKEMLEANGIEDGVINASGDLVAWGNPPGEEFWKIAIADPNAPDQIFCWLPIKNKAVATSGDYEKYVLIDGRRHAHIIDPKTGYPTSGIKSATVISPSAELSDALATAIFVLGLENGLDLIEQLPQAESLIIDDENNFHFSSNLDFIKNEK